MSFYEESTVKKTQRQVTGDDPYTRAKNLLSIKMGDTFSPEEISNGGPKVVATAKELAYEIYMQDVTTAAETSTMGLEMDRETFITKVLSELLSLGPIDELLKDQSIEDIAINGHTEVTVFRDGKWYNTGITFESPQRLLDILNRGVAAIGRQANITNPIVDGILPGRERINIGTDPIATPWPAAVIRIPRTKGLQLTDLVKPYIRKGLDGDLTYYPTVAQSIGLSDEIVMPPFEQYAAEGGVLNAALAKYLFAAVNTGLNIVIAGATGVGKTSMLTALGRALPMGKRMLIIEDTPEIELYPEHDNPMNVVYLRTRHSTLDGVSPITQADLVKLALRQRPDGLTLGEARGEEMFDLLTALNTGHKNGLTSLHTDSVEEVFDRVLTMLGQSSRGMFLGKELSAKMVSKSFHILIALDLAPGGKRQVKAVAEFTGGITEGTSPAPKTQLMFTTDGGVTRGPLNTSVHAQEFIEAGFSPEIFQPSP